MASQENNSGSSGAPKVDYVFTRDFLDNNRINLMHTLWSKIFGYNIHPSIPTNRPDLRVADVGTGTGIWLFDVRESVDPSARLEGFDVSFDAAPPKETLQIRYQERPLEEPNEGTRPLKLTETPRSSLTSIDEMPVSTNKNVNIWK